MSLLSAINSALSGLNAQSTQLGNISNNVANSSTVGYKKADTNFETMVLNGGGTASADLAGVATTTRMDIGTAGQIQSTGVSTDLAVNGSGFMVVNTNANSGLGSYLLTQAGSFRPDANGNLVNAAGYYLQGQPLDATGAVIGTPASSLANLTTVNVANLAAAAQPTTTMAFSANLPSTDTAYATTAPPPSSSSVTYYDALGNANSLQFQFTPTLPTSAGSPDTNTWTMEIFDSGSSTPTTPIASATLQFNGSGPNAGTLASVTPISGTGTYDGTTGDYTITTGAGADLPIDIGALNSASGMTQLNGAYTTTKIQQDGAPFGLLQGVSIASDGVVNASFSNGSTRPIYQIDVATVPNPDGLTPVQGNAYAVSPQAGVAVLQQPGTGAAGTMDAGALEGSNVDISSELTNMIETQRAYSSTAMVIQTGDQMLDVVNHLNQ